MEKNKKISETEKINQIKQKLNTEKMKRRAAVFNKYSLLFHILIACGVCFLIEWVSRHSFIEACVFVVDRNLAFLYNSLLIYASLMLVYIVKRRSFFRVLISLIWLVLGIINGCVLAKRVTPFGFTDFKMIGDLFTMQSNYFSAFEAVIVIIATVILICCMTYFWFKGKKFSGKMHPVLAVIMICMMGAMIPRVTDAAVENNVLTEYFENLAQGYKDYGFVYSFSASVLDRGMSTPDEYSEESVKAVLEMMSGSSASVSSEEENKALPYGAGDAEASLIDNEAVKTTASEVQMNTEEAEEIPEEGRADQEYPNIICVLLESFVDPGLIRFLEMSDDPVPNFHELYDTYSSGYVEVPVVGAGTANSEFEILTGMGMQFFGLGEYPYKTILKETNCESIAGVLKKLGYGAHVIHNNGGNFYSRAEVFANMGFDTFTSKEMMDIREYTPTGNWATDDILVGEVEKTLDYTPEQSDFIYTITVEGHGEYPEEKILENPEIKVSGLEEEDRRNSWEYYVNQIHQVDDFIGDLIAMLEQREEPTLVVMFGDHLPTMGLTEEDMKTGSLFLTQYITWNNFGLEKQDGNMTAYQLLADMLAKVDIQAGTMFTYHQNRENISSEEEYQKGMELLQYDILYGEGYVYGGTDPYPASNLIMGTQNVVIEQVIASGKYYYVTGQNFTKWSKVHVNDEKESTKYISSSKIRFKKEALKEGLNTIVVNQMGSSNTIFRSSNEIQIEIQSKEEVETEE